MWRKILILFAVFSASVSGNRVKRHLVFNKGSRLFFSVDVRDNLFDFSDLFANVFGFKIDWDLPTNAVQVPKKGHVQRRDLYQGIENLLYYHNFNGTSCVQKFLCEACNILQKKEHFLAQLYAVIFAPKQAEILNSYNINDVKKDCKDILKKKSKKPCPFSLLSLLHEVPLPGNSKKRETNNNADCGRFGNPSWI